AAFSAHGLIDACGAFVDAVLRATLWTRLNCHNCLRGCRSSLCALPDSRASAPPDCVSQQLALLAQMFPEMFQHPPPRIRRSFGVVDLRPRIIEERVVRVITHYFDRQVVLRGELAQL